MAQAQRRQIVRVGEHHVAAAGDAAIAVVEAVDGGIVLIMAANGGEGERAVAAPVILVDAGEEQELRLAVRGLPFARRGADGQAEAAGLADARVEVAEIGEDDLDLVADMVIVRDQAVPVHLGEGQRRLGDAGDDCGLRTQIG